MTDKFTGWKQRPLAPALMFNKKRKYFGKKYNVSVLVHVFEKRKDPGKYSDTAQYSFIFEEMESRLKTDVTGKNQDKIQAR